MQALGKVIEGFRERGGLPRVVRLARSYGPWRKGDLLVWSEGEGAFTDGDGYVCWPVFVKAHWGVLFERSFYADQLALELSL